MVQVTKIGYAGFNTTHMEAMLAYYTEVIGFTLEERAGDGAAYLSNALDHHAIALYPSTESGLRHIGFQIQSRGSELIPNKQAVIERLDNSQTCRHSRNKH